MNLANDIRARLKPMSYEERDAVAKATGVPFSTVQKIAIGQTEDPRVSTVEALAKYFGMTLEIAPMQKAAARDTAKAA